MKSDQMWPEANLEVDKLSDITVEAPASVDQGSRESDWTEEAQASQFQS